MWFCPQYKGVLLPALHTSPKTPVEASDTSPDTEGKETRTRFNFDNVSGDGDNLTDSSYDDTLKVGVIPK